MHPNFDFESYGLFCSEDNNSIMGFGEDDDDDVVVVVAAEEQRYYQPGQSQSHGCSQDFLMEFPVTDVSLGEMVENECHNMPREDYKRRLESGVLDSSLRTFAVDWIGKTKPNTSIDYQSYIAKKAMEKKDGENYKACHILKLEPELGRVPKHQPAEHL
ncbi:hypothetical protein MRB53_022004 [Persea americana]|uniref:Uncharacterized protein n=1 Tax=Persea americana TaxID=3435 RepID=A0ACC2L5J7_PERAE|nr:hypothetical protein MRB53_022004 [Persea americana]